MLVFHIISTQIVKYPPLDGAVSDQGVGPHYDAGFLTFVCYNLADLKFTHVTNSLC
jgi:isopenicillin N synthase-like dioxygenase